MARPPKQITTLDCMSLRAKVESPHKFSGPSGSEDRTIAVDQELLAGLCRLAEREIQSHVGHGLVGRSGGRTCPCVGDYSARIACALTGCQLCRGGAW